MIAVLWQQDVSLFKALGAAVLVGAFGGVFNGVLVAYAGLSAFVATLGTLTIFSGLALLVSDGKTIFGRAIPEFVGDFSRGGIPLAEGIQLPNLTLIAILVLILMGIVLQHTVFGRNLHAVGGNREASILAGVPVAQLRLIAFAVNGVEQQLLD